MMTSSISSGLTEARSIAVFDDVSRHRRARRLIECAAKRAADRRASDRDDYRFTHALHSRHPST